MSEMCPIDTLSEMSCEPCEGGVAPLSEPEIADRLEILATDHEKRIQMAHAALANVRQFSADRQAGNLVELAQRLLDGKAKE